MSDGVVLRPLERLDEGVLVGLVELLVATVDAPSDDRRGAASIGFLPPLAPAEAEAYWRGVLAPGVLLWVAERDGRVVGSAQLPCVCARTDCTGPRSPS